MTIIDAITSSPFNVFFTFVIGLGLAYLYYRKPSSSSSSSSTSTSSRSITQHSLSRAFSNNHRLGLDAGVIDVDLQRTIAQIERQERDMIRQEQDEAYQQSLKADREKKLRREQELKTKEAKEREEREKAEQIERLHQRLARLKSIITSKLPSEPIESDRSDGIVKLVFKLPDGSRVKRNFYKSDKVKSLYWFVFSLERAPLQFKMTTNFPKRDLPGRPPLPEDFEDELSCSENNCEQTLEEINLTETQIIFVYDLEA